TRKSSDLCPPSYRTFCPNRQAEMPTLRRGWSEARGRGAAISCNVVLHADFASGVLGAHVSDLAEDGPHGPPRAIVAAENPEDAAVGVRIPAVQGVLVVQLDHDLERLLGRRRPFEDLLSPDHSEIVVDAALADQLSLGGVPERIV